MAETPQPIQPTETTVVGVFAKTRQAEQALHELKRAGFTDKQIGFMVRRLVARTEAEGEAEQQESRTGEATEVAAGGIIGALLGAAEVLLLPVTGPTDANNLVTASIPVGEQVLERLRGHKRADAVISAGEERADAAGSATPGDASSGEETRHTRIDEGAGTAAGGFLGGVLGAAMAFLIPGIGPVVAGGILVSVVGGAAIGAVTGGILGTFVGMGIPERFAHHYRREVEAGRTIVTVMAGARQQEAMDILQHQGALDVQAH